MERKQVARKSYADPHKRQKVVHSTEKVDNGKLEEDAPMADVISIDEDTNEEKPHTPEESEKTTTVIDVDDESEANADPKDDKSAPVSEETPAQEEPTSTNDVSSAAETNEVEKPSSAEEVPAEKVVVENGDTHESSEVVAEKVGEEKATEESADPDSTTNTTKKAETTEPDGKEENLAKTAEDPPSVTEPTTTAD